MTSATGATSTEWKADVQALKEWLARDAAFLDHMKGSVLSEWEVSVLQAVAKSQGDPVQLRKLLSTMDIARLTARAAISDELRLSPAEAWKRVRANLEKSWSPKAKAVDVSKEFYKRYKVRLESLEGAAGNSVAALERLEASLKTMRTANDLKDAAMGLQGQIQELQEVVRSCSHPEGAAWAKEVASMAREAKETLDSAKSLLEGLKSAQKQCVELAQSLREWREMAPKERAATAEAMASRVAAAREVVVSMRDDLIRTLLPVRKAPV